MTKKSFRFDETQQAFSKELAITAQKEVDRMMVLMANAAMLISDEPNVSNTILASTLALASHRMLVGHAATLITPEDRKKFMKPSRELMLFSAIYAVHSCSQIGAVDAFELAKRDLAKLGHELPETLLEIVT